MERDSMGEILKFEDRQPATSFLRKFARPKTFQRTDALKLAARLSGLWTFLLTDITADELADEYVRQFDGYDHLTVERAVTAAIGKATGRPPSPGQIKAEIRAVMTAKPDTSAYSYKPSPEIQKRNTAAYEAWRVKDDELTREAAEKARNMSPETLKRLGIDPQGIGTRALKRRGAERED